MSNEIKRMDYTDSYGDLIKVTPVLNMYRDNDNLYVGLTSYDEDLEAEDNYCDLTVNVYKLPYLHSAIDTTYSGEAKLKFLQEQGFGELTGNSLRSGFCTYPVFRFNEDKLREIDPETFKAYAKAHNVSLDAKEPLDAKINKAKNRPNGAASQRREPSLDNKNVER